MDIRETILSAIERRGLSERKVSNDVFGHDTAIRDLKRSGSLSTSRLIPLCEYLGLQLTIGDYNSADKRRSELEQFATEVTDILDLPEATELPDVQQAILALRGPATAATESAYKNMDLLSELIADKVAEKLSAEPDPAAGMLARLEKDRQRLLEIQRERRESGESLLIDDVLAALKQEKEEQAKRKNV